MAFIHTGLAAGLAPGAALSGMVVDVVGASPAYLVSAASGLVATLAAPLLPRSPARSDGRAAAGQGVPPGQPEGEQAPHQAHPRAGDRHHGGGGAGGGRATKRAAPDGGDHGHQRTPRWTRDA